MYQGQRGKKVRKKRGGKVEVKVGPCLAPAYLGGSGGMFPRKIFMNDIDSQMRILSHSWQPENSFLVTVVQGDTWYIRTKP